MTPPDSREKWPTVTPLSAAAGQTVPKKFPPLHFSDSRMISASPGGVHEGGIEALILATLVDAPVEIPADDAEQVA